ncbi:MAG: 16S rRNA (cytosine(967)-C(5))-methyltransferase RsmB [Legionella sp.]
MKANERLQAFTILNKLLTNRIALSHLLQTTYKSSPLTQEICFGVCRHFFRLEALANYLLKKKPKETEIWLIILIGLYQLHYMRIADYAVVKETVALLDIIKKKWAKGFVNAVLRTFARNHLQIIPLVEEDQRFKHNHPEWLVERIQSAWPDHWQTILEANDKHPPMILRVNRIQSNRQDYLTHLNHRQIAARPVEYAEQAIELTKPCNVDDLPGFVEGEISVQDTAAQMAVTLLALQPGLNILDACCAPGGKTCHILESQPALASCTALDIDSHRLKKVIDNLARNKLQANVICADALNPADWWDGNLYDRILLDAPCSATGVIRRHPDIKLLRNSDEILAIIKIQQQLLQTLWPLLKPNGRLVYATCSILPEENDQQIGTFVAAHSDCQVDCIPHQWGMHTQHGWQILPGTLNMDGFFYSVLRKHQPLDSP